MTKRNKQAIAVIAIVLIVFSIVVFIIPFRKGSTFWIAYTAELLAVALQFPVFKLAYGNAEDLKSKVLGFPVFRVGYIYLTIQTIASIILFVLGGTVKHFPAWISLIVCMVILAAAIICSIATDIARDEVEKIEAVQKKDTEFIKLMRVKSQNLVNENKNEGISAMLDELSEKFRYSDPVSSSATTESETKIDILFGELEATVHSGNESKSKVICEKLNTVIDSRNNICKLNK
ncbi:hypothetical protein [Porcipelethomonas sp.]|uniref:hypothetical protein n=1 Tax=Porcipelethomonas sp. TaxID=2981675 RepID=UPI003EFAF7CE